MSDIGVLVTLDEESLKNRAVLDYTSRDFTAIRAQLIGLAKGYLPAWNTAGESADFGTLLLELFAYMGDTLHYYIDRTASEAFLSTAVRTQSVYYIADMLGYMPIGQHAASVYVTFNITIPVEEEAASFPDVIIPKGTKVHNTADNADNLVVFEISEEVVLKPSGTPEEQTVRVFAEEGVTTEENVGMSLGHPNTEFVLGQVGVIYGSISVTTVEGYETVSWIYTSDLALARPTQTVFTTYVDDQNRTHIVFGDNASGRIPAVNARIHAIYRYGVGARANELVVGEIDTIVPPPNVDLSFVTVTNDGVPLGGSDPESIESLKYNIPRAGARIKSRAVTLNDYADLALQVPGVAKSVAYGTVYTSVHVRIAPTGGDALPEHQAELCEEVEQYMADKILIGSSVIAEPEDTVELWQNAYIRLHVVVIGSFNRSAVRDQVDAVIRKYLSFDSVDFGMRVSMGSIYRAALSIQGVEWCELKWLSPNEPPSDTPPARNIPIQEASASQVLFTGIWELSTDNTPPTGLYYTDNTTTPTTLVISYRDTNYSDTPDHGVALNDLQIGDHIVLRPVNETWSWFDLIITEAPVDTPGTPGYVTLTVLINQTAADLLPPVTGDDVLFDFIRYNPTPTTAGDVADIVTNELLIPRIEPTEIVEESEIWIEAFPDDEDRTHDGLWVVATGGLAGT